MDSAPTVKTKDGYVLKLVPGGTFSMGSERREQGRRPNEPLRKVTLKRPFYIGVNEVTNEDYRRFRPGHASGYIGKLSLDLDKQAVSQVSWNEAAEYCNWLSEREGLPLAYEKRDNRYVLKRPVTTGYRLPTEAEWEYAARRAGPEKMLRFPWGNALPIAAETGNLAGSEAGKIVEGELPGYQDGYVVIAPVGKFTPNALGLHDIGGNVSEWVNDYYLSFVDTADSTDPLGPEEAAKHVIRGANWRSNAVSELRLAWRDTSDGMSATIGFRVARYAE
jgi:formylglycine-generating enzyme required for sulfatase activity